MPGVKSLIVALLVMAVGAASQERERNKFISVTFAVDGKSVTCDDLKVDLRLDNRHIAPKQTVHGFLIPSEFDKKSSGSLTDKKVDVSVSCGEYRLSFPELNSTWVSSGQWELGIAYPPYWIERFGWTNAVEQGTWLSYLSFECDGCDPGVFTTISHQTPPPAIVSRLRHEQTGASGGEARDIAYALAVFGSDYQRNRDYLVELLGSCLSRPKESPEDDVCDGKLLDYLTNLYWRGDNRLLEILLQSADSRKDVILEIGTFYANLLDRHMAAALQGLSLLPNEKQELICRLAGEDDLSIDSPKFERVKKNLGEAHNEVADRCLSAAARFHKP